MMYKEIQLEISHRKIALRRSNCQESEYREEMNKLQLDERVIYRINIGKNVGIV